MALECTKRRERENPHNCPQEMHACLQLHTSASKYRIHKKPHGRLLMASSQRRQLLLLGTGCSQKSSIAIYLPVTALPPTVKTGCPIMSARNRQNSLRHWVTSYPRVMGFSHSPIQPSLPRTFIPSFLWPLRPGPSSPANCPF